jgi:predicted phosphodiesterase
MTSIALLADIHLPDRDDTVKELVWSWALAEAQRQGAELLLGLGDLTSIGSLKAARRIRRQLAATGLPYLLSPGNAELRSREQSAAVLRELGTPRQHGPAMILDSARGALSERSRTDLKELARSGRRNLLLATHIPPTELPEEDRRQLELLRAAGIVGCLVVGHKHWDKSCDSYEQIRGLDPDKVQGGPAALVIMRQTEQGWQRRDIPCPLADPCQWPESERREWLAQLGISTMKETLAGLADASAEGVGAVELRYEATQDIAETSLLAALAAWRAAGGRCLSMHCPSIGWQRGEVTGEAELRSCVDLCRRLGVDRVTFHVPGATVQALRSDAALYDKLLTSSSDCLRPLTDAGIVIGVENMHMRAHERVGEERGFGYLPQECQEWIRALRARLGEDAVGFHLDIGHARNNNWYASRYNLSEWYAEMGSWLNGCHLHQYCQVEGRYGNHYPLHEIHGRVISLSSFFMSWRLGQCRRAPMFLEIRHEPSIVSYRSLRSALGL